MNNTLHFITPGTLDMRAITVFGLSAKPGKENPIGYFGTGLKYAIAILIRHGATIAINTGGETYTFGVNTDTFRNKEYESISMSSSLRTVELPFTTELGKGWDMWMAFRELYCNTLDENGVIRESSGSYITPDWHERTTITVISDEFYTAYVERGNYFISDDRNPITIGEQMEVYEGGTEYMFYRGIRVGTQLFESIFTWNYKFRLELTEDRTAKYNFVWEGPVTTVIVFSHDKEFIHRCVTAEEGTMENRLAYSSAGPVGPEFLEVMEPLAMDYTGRVNASAKKLYEYHANKKMGARDSVPLNVVEQSMLTKAIKVCTNLDQKPNEVPIIITKSLGTGVLGLSVDGKVFLSKEVFNMGTKMVAGTLYEELLHHETRMMDMTRTLQNHLINKIMSMYEENTGEPL